MKTETCIDCDGPIEKDAPKDTTQCFKCWSKDVDRCFPMKPVSAEAKQIVLIILILAIIYFATR